MTKLVFKSEMDVDYIDHMGSDARIAHAAWVSTKGVEADGSFDPVKVKGLINSLMKNRHGTPFECGALTVRVHAPIKVWREWHRHRVGFSYNEESGRYKQLDPVFYVPSPDRPMIRPEGFKSMKPDFLLTTPDQYERITTVLKAGYEYAYELHENALAEGADRGLARDVLGVGIYSACYVTCNPRSCMHFLELRTRHDDAKRPSHPLWEINQAANKLEAIFARLWPITHATFCEHGRSAP